MESWLNQNEVDIWLNCDRPSDKISRYRDLYEELDAKKVNLFLATMKNVTISILESKIWTKILIFDKTFDFFYLLEI